MILQSKGNCRKGGESENSPDSLKKTSSSLRFSPLPQVGTVNFKILLILALARPPQCATTDATAFCNPFRKEISSCICRSYAPR